MASKFRPEQKGPAPTGAHHGRRPDAQHAAESAALRAAAAGSPAVAQLAESLAALILQPVAVSSLGVLKRTAESVIATARLAGAGGPESHVARSGLSLYCRFALSATDRPLVRALLSPLSRLPPGAASLAAQTALADALADPAMAGGGEAAARASLAVSAAVAAVIAAPGPLPAGALATSSVPLTLALAGAISWVAEGGGAGVGILADLREAVASLQALLSRHAPHLAAHSALGPAARALISALASPLLGRESSLPAAAALAAAATGGDGAASHGMHLAAALYDVALPHGIPPSVVDDALSRCPGPGARSLAEAVGAVGGGGRLALVRGAIAAAVPAALLAPLGREPSGESFGESSGESFGESGESSGESRGSLFGLLLAEVLSRLETEADPRGRWQAAAAAESLLRRLLTAATEGGEFGRCGAVVGAFLSPAAGGALLAAAMARADDPLPQTAKAALGILSTLLDCEDAGCRAAETAGAGMGAGGDRPLMRRAAAAALALPGHAKARYAPLAMLVPRLGAGAFLSARPSLLAETISSLRHAAVGCAAAAFLEPWLRRLLGEMTAAARGGNGGKNGGMSGGMDAAEAWHAVWAPPMLAALRGGSPSHRAAVAEYALGPALRVRPESLAALVAALAPPGPNDSGITDSGITDSAITDSGVSDWAASDAADAGRSAALVAVLHAAAAAGLIEAAGGLSSVVGDASLPVKPPDGGGGAFVGGPTGGAGPLRIPLSLLTAAASHRCEAVRLDCLELLCIRSKPAALPGRLELSLLRASLPLCMRCGVGATRQRLVALLRRLMDRLKAGLSRAEAALCGRVGKRHGLTRGELAPRGGGGGSTDSSQSGAEPPMKAVTQSGTQTLTQCGTEFIAESVTPELALLLAEAGAAAVFLRWLARFLVCSLYPGAPYERKFLALELLRSLAALWPPPPPPPPPPVPHAPELPWAAAHPAPEAAVLSLPGDLACFDPWGGCLGPRGTLLLIEAITDSWDAVRDSAYAALSLLPSPLPGLQSQSQLLPLLARAAALMDSARVRDADAGALIFRAAATKYGLGRGWRLGLHPRPFVFPRRFEFPAAPRAKAPVASLRARRLLADACGQLESRVVAATGGGAALAAACARGLAHGPLLCTRYLIGEIDFGGGEGDGGGDDGDDDDDAHDNGDDDARDDAQDDARPAGPRALLRRLLAAVLALTDVAAEVLESPTPAGAGAGDVVEPGDDVIDDVTDDVNDDVTDDVADDVMAGGAALAPRAQVIVSACWLTVKEASLVLGALARAVPLGKRPGDRVSGEDVNGEDVNGGAVSGVSGGGGGELLDGGQLAAFGAHFLRIMTSLKHNGAIDKTRAGFVALCDRLLRADDPDLAALPGQWATQVLESMARPGQTRADIVRRSAGLPFAVVAAASAEPAGGRRPILESLLSRLLASAVAPDDVSDDVSDHVMDDDIGAVAPKIHALNAMRLAFSTTPLAVATAGCLSPALGAALESLGSRFWEVRNAGSQCFDALVTRALGYKNACRPRRSITLEGLLARARRGGGEGGGEVTCDGDDDGMDSGGVPMGPGSKGAVGAEAFFSKHPALAPLLAAHLAAAVASLEADARDARITDSRITDASPRITDSSPRPLHPSLHPVLVLITRLAPGAAAPSESSDDAGPAAAAAAAAAATLPALAARALVARPAAVRALAARAILPLLPPGEAIPWVAAAELLTSLPATPNIPSTPRPPSPGEGAASPLLSLPMCVGVLSTNATHGRLLAARELLRSRLPPTPGAAAAALAACCEALTTRAHLGGAKSPPAIQAEWAGCTRAALLAAPAPSGDGDHATVGLGVVESAAEALRVAAAAAATAAVETARPSPGAWLAAKRWATLRVTLSLSRPDGVAAAAAAALGERQYEARGAALRAVLRGAAASTGLARAAEGVAAAAYGAIPGESDGECLLRTIQLAGLAGAVATSRTRVHDGPGTRVHGESWTRVHDARWAGVWGALQRGKSPAVKEEALRLLGCLARQGLESPSNHGLESPENHGLESLAGAWARAAAAAAPPSSRLAAAHSLHASGALDSNHGLESLGRAWRLALTLLEDDDPSVRSAAAAAAAAAMGGEAGDLGAAQPESVAAAALPWLGRRLGASPGFRVHLRSLFESPPAPMPRAGGGAGPATGRLFDHEADNQHEEPLLAAQRAVVAARALLAAGEVPPAEAADWARLLAAWPAHAFLIGD